MAKKKSTLGKLLAFTTTVAAIGGTCYIFRDKIKQSSVYKMAADKCSDLWEKWNTKDFDDDDEDFFLEDEDEVFDDVFSEEEKKNREYTSITINQKDEEAEKPIEEPVEKPASDVIPAIVTEEAEPEVSEKTEEEVIAYENEGLSDVSEDPDVLEEQDQLDF